MSVRQPPSSTLDRLSSLTIGDGDRKAAASQAKDPLPPPLPDLTAAEGTGAGLVQRCVVVQKDQLGFGFTVCGERIKLVQNVRPGGAAVKAGVHEGDRIIKVNGSLVSSMSHQEVVKLIKSGTYVALTLQGPAPSAAAVPLQPLCTDLLPNHRPLCSDLLPNHRTASPPPAPPLPPSSTSTPGGYSHRITGPKPLQDPEVQKHASEILRKMLEQEEAELQALLEECSRNPTPSLEERIESAKRRASQVRVKLHQDLDGKRPESVTSYFTAGEGRLSMESSEGDFEVCESPHSSPSSSSFRISLHRRQGSDTHSTPEPGGKAQIIGPEEEEEDEDGYTFNEVDGPFQDLELLKSRPAHMTVFMRYVFSQLLDPNPLLFYLTVEAYLGSSPKDARGLAPQVVSHFLDPDAPLRIKVREEYLKEIDARLQAQPQEDIRGPLSELQQQVLPDIQDQIQDYRSKQMMGLGSLFGESDLQQLDGDPTKERQVVDRQVTALWEILSKHEEERSSPLASAVLLYLRHSGIKLRDSRVFPGLASEKEKWLPFFPKAKRLSSGRKDKDGEDKRRNPILKYIAKPKSSSQSTFHVPLSPSEVRPGNVRNIIQQFENNTDVGEEGGETDAQRLSSSSFGDDSMDSPTFSVRLARSESLKAQGEGRRRGNSSGAESVPRSRSDVDMEDCGEEREGVVSGGLRPLQHSASSSASSSSARSLENPTPPYTPRSRRRSVELPAALLPDAPALEEDVPDGQNWQETVEARLLSSLSPREIDRQAVIYELFLTEVSHLRTLRVLDQVFYQRMRSVLTMEELDCIFPNLRHVYELHSGLCESLRRLRESTIVHSIGDVMLARFEGSAGEEFQERVAHLCSQQSQALDLIKSKQRKDPRFAHIIQECEASPHCRRLQLKDLLVSEMQRLTKYPLLLDNIIKHTEGDSADMHPLHRAQARCRGILQTVNEYVRETEHRQRLSQYQRRLDISQLERHPNTAAAQFKNLDLTTKRMIHEGPLTWKVSKDKALEVHALLLCDLLVLLQKGPDDKLVLRCPSRWQGGGGGGSGDAKTPFCPIVRLDSLLVRSVATDNKALYVISTSERQIYELVAGTSSEKNTWKDLLEKTILLATENAGSTKQGSPQTTSNLDSPGGPVFQPEVSLSKNSASLEQDSPSDEDSVLTPTTPADPAAAFLSSEQRGGIADAALHDVETLRQLIFRDLDDGWSQDTDDTPTNETANDRSPFPDKQPADQPDAEPASSSSQWEAEEVDAPPPEVESPSVKVMRKAVVAGSPSLPDDITDDVNIHSSQSAESRGNLFYLVMPQEPSSSGATDESSTDDIIAQPPPLLEPTISTSQRNSVAGSGNNNNEDNGGDCVPLTNNDATSSASGLPLTNEEQPEGDDVASSSSCRGEGHRASGADGGGGQSPVVTVARRHVVKNVDEIFHTIEELMSKLHKLREIESAHTQLLKTLHRSSTDEQVLDEVIRQSTPTVVRTPSLDRGGTAGDGKEGGPSEPRPPEIQSTGF
ncbi:rho guanine nucleotide exchange factor 11 isoform X2 [Engraulis encrasicolus]|uniref:rho guanine nucleotide exchange factor 11 isoform X2 n=1 Tax=Engraulis encrasicolus TaxID=184585 RepID=UPI002FCEC752